MNGRQYKSDGSSCPHVVVGIPCLSTGGTERQALLLVKALAGSCRITLVCYHECDDNVAAGFREAGAVVELLNWKRPIPAVAFVLRMSGVLRNLRPDIVHIQYMAPGFLPLLAARIAGVRRVLTTINYHAAGHGYLPRILVQLAAILCDRVICVSEAVESSWFGSSRLLDPDSPAELPGRHLTVHNAVDAACIDSIVKSVSMSSLRNQLGIGGEPVVGTVSRLSREKGVDLLIKAFADVRAKWPGARLLAIGGGPERDRLEKLVSRLGLAGAVIFTGACRWEDTIRYLSIMDLTVVPSFSEGFGLAASEAMACSKPVVSTGVGGLAEVVADGKTGSVFHAGDEQGLAAAVVRLLQDADLRLKMGRAGRERVLRMFSMDLFSRRWRRI